MVAEKQSLILACDSIDKVITSGNNTITILEAVSLQIFAGDTIAITGRSGSGKTTLVRLLSGLDIPTSGQILLFQKKFSALTEDERAALRGRYMGIVFQSFHLLTGFSVLENVMLPLEMQGDANARDQAERILEQVGMIDHRKHYPHVLSGGEQQRVAIARAFAGKPKFLLADEPTGNLDDKTSAEIIDLFFALNEAHNVALLLVTHALSLSKRCKRHFKVEDARLKAVS